jgi:hypothetical protein
VKPVIVVAALAPVLVAAAIVIGVLGNGGSASSVSSRSVRSPNAEAVAAIPTRRSGFTRRYGPPTTITIEDGAECWHYRVLVEADVCFEPGGGTRFSFLESRTDSGETYLMGGSVP